MPGEQRDAIKAFGKEVARDQIQSALRDVFFTPSQTVPEWQRFNNSYTDIVQLGIRRTVLAQDAPGWLNTASYLQELDKINSPQLWQSLFQKTQPGTIEHMIKAAKKVHVQDVNSLAGDVGKSNLKFFSIALLYISTAAISGDQFRKYLAADTRKEINPHIIDFGERLGRFFRTPPQTPEELLERFQQLFPVDGQRTGFTAMDMLINSRAFNHADDPSGVCPAVKMTDTIFQEYGKMLREPEYQARFLAVVTNVSQPISDIA